MFHMMIATYYDLTSPMRHFTNAFIIKHASDVSHAVFRRTLHEHESSLEHLLLRRFAPGNL